MSSFQEVEATVEALERRRARVRRKLETEAARLETAVGNLNSAVLACQRGAAGDQASGQGFLKALRAATASEAAAVADRLNMLSDKASERVKVLTGLDADAVAIAAGNAAADFAEKAAVEIEQKIEMMLVEVKDTFTKQLQAEGQELDDLLQEARQDFDEKAEEWETKLADYKNVLGQKLDELTKLNIEELWDETRDRMQAEFIGEIDRVSERLSNLRETIETNLGSIRRILDMFSDARRIKDVGVQGAGSGLEIIASILTDLEEIFSSVT